MKFAALVLLLWGTPIPFNWAIERELKRAGLVNAYRSSRLLLLRSDVHRAPSPFSERCSSALSGGC